MCLGIPVRITKIDGSEAEGEIGGLKRKIDLSILENVKTGDFVILHAGFAIERVDEEQAQETLQLMRELAESTGGVP